MKFNVVAKSVFSGEVSLERFDAEFVDPDILNIENQILVNGSKRIEEITSRHSGSTINSSYANEDDSIKYISIDSVDNEDGLTYCEEILFKDRPSRAKYELKTNDILVSNVRPNRNAVTLITSRNAGNLASSGFTLLRSKDIKDFTPEYLFAFLKTPYGYSQLIRRNRGSMYPAVVERDVLDILIPKPNPKFLEEITLDVKQGLQLHDEFFVTLAKQNNLLDNFLSPIGSPPSPLLTNRHGIDWTEIHKRDCLISTSPLRIDAEFFRQEYEDFNLACQKLGQSFLLGEYFLLSPGRGLGNKEEIVPYVKQSVLTNSGINWSAISYEEGSSKSSVGRVKTGDILLACTAHEIYYVGRKVDFVREVPLAIQKNNFAVADLMILRPRSNKPSNLYGSYVAAFLRHPSGLHQVQRCIRGLRGGHVYKSDLSQYVRVPIPSNAWLEQFESLSSQAEAKRNNAKIQLKGAFAKVERWVAQFVKTLIALENIDETA